MNLSKYGGAKMIIDSDLTNIIESLVGKFEIINEHRKDSTRTGVFEIKANNETMYVKIHNRLSRWNPEVYAYKNWTSILEPYAPKLLNCFNDDKFFGIVITPIQGKTVNEFQITDEKVLENVYFKAGELLKILHNNFTSSYFGIPSLNGTPFEKNIKTDPIDYVASTLAMLLKEGYDKGLLDNSDKSLVEWCIKNSNAFNNSKPVPTNWDFSQNNWMIDSSGNFTGFIDFENMLWGIDIDNFGVVLERYTQDKPKLTQAMFEGYGLENDVKREIQLRIVSVKLAVADIIYGSSNNDNRIFSLARNMLNNLK